MSFSFAQSTGFGPQLSREFRQSDHKLGFAVQQAIEMARTDIQNVLSEVAMAVD